MPKDDKTTAYYTLANTMFGKTTYPSKGPIELNESTSQKDLSFLFNECGMQDITVSNLTAKQLQVIKKKQESKKD